MKSVIRKMSCVFLLIIIGTVNSQVLHKDGFKLGGHPTQGPTSNFINDILIVLDSVWVGARDLSRTVDLGNSWTTFSQEDGLGKGGISAMAYNKGVFWVATAFDTLVQDNTFLPAGGGLSFSADHGKSWLWIPQPKDSVNEIRYNPTTTHVQNITYDIAISDSAVWITSFGGGLRKSTDTGLSWEVVTVDGNPFSAIDFLSHRAFSAVFDGEALWVGTAGGVHKSTDEGRHWTTFNHQNQTEPISGNFVVALGNQQVQNRKIIWAATWEALGIGEFRGVSKSEDGGLTWTVMLEGESAHNFAFDDSIVYVATNNGLFKSRDYGETWAVYPQIVDSQTGEHVFTSEMYSAGVGPQNSLWVGTGDGLAMTRDDGLTWTIFRAYQVTGVGNTPVTYAYPNPFSPMRYNVYGGDGHVRFQYRTNQSTQITVEVYDFGMNLVYSVVRDKLRPVPGDYSEAWNGRNELGDVVANGVYFYRISFSGGETLWGKVMVVN
jgi:photosystem II stability/assembly factor-like uncharacterized protein